MPESTFVASWNGGFCFVVAKNSIRHTGMLLVKIIINSEHESRSAIVSVATYGIEKQEIDFLEGAHLPEE
jgi:hypothetical protein